MKFIMLIELNKIHSIQLSMLLFNRDKDDDRATVTNFV